jgi:hypothetical protein
MWLGGLQVYQTHLVEQVVMWEQMIFGCTPPNYLCLDIQHKNITYVEIEECKILTRNTFDLGTTYQPQTMNFGQYEIITMVNYINDH